MNMATMEMSISIFAIYADQCNHIFSSEHDVLYGPHIDDLPGMTENHEQILIDYGWTIGAVDRWEHECSC